MVVVVVVVVVGGAENAAGPDNDGPIIASIRASFIRLDLLYTLCLK